MYRETSLRPTDELVGVPPQRERRRPPLLDVASDRSLDTSFDRFRATVDQRLEAVLASERDRWCRVDADLSHGFDQLIDFVRNGGKRFRPAFAYWAFVGSGGDPDDCRIVDLAAALEMLHTFALVHDDVMDGSDMRRHAPSVHRFFQSMHEARAWRGETRRFGEGMAVLLGDLAFVYADHFARTLPVAVADVFHEMKVELHVGQYLDLLGAAQSHQSVPRAEIVIRYKTAKYSVERPLHLGSTLAGVDDTERTRALSEFGLAVGEAFQLRDDLLGAFGDARCTGKPIGEDFREGKETPLIVLTREWATRVGPNTQDDARDFIAFGRLGSPDLSDAETAAIQRLIARSGARAQIERRIVELANAARRALPNARLAPPAESALLDLAQRAAWRSR